MGIGTRTHTSTYSITAPDFQDLLLMEKQTLVESDTRRGRLQNISLSTQRSNINLHNSCKKSATRLRYRQKIRLSCAGEDPR